MKRRRRSRAGSWTLSVSRELGYECKCFNTYIGSYTFAKTLEYKAKHGLQAGKEVTVLPPSEYQERFVNTLADYFVPCPGRWYRIQLEILDVDSF